MESNKVSHVKEGGTQDLAMVDIIEGSVDDMLDSEPAAEEEEGIAKSFKSRMKKSKTSMKAAVAKANQKYKHMMYYNKEIQPRKKSEKLNKTSVVNARAPVQKVRWAKSASIELYDPNEMSAKFQKDKCLKKKRKFERRKKTLARKKFDSFMDECLQGGKPMNKKFFLNSLSAKHYKIWMSKQLLLEDEKKAVEKLSDGSSHQEWRKVALAVFERVAQSKEAY